MRVAALLLVLLAVVGGDADAQETPAHTSEEHRYSIRLPADFVSNPQSDEPHSLGSYAEAGGLAMSLSRIDYPNLPARWRNDKEDFFQQVLHGAQRATPGYKQKSKKSQRMDRVPILDLHFSRDGKAGKELVWIRFLFHRQFAIVATASTPARAKRALQKKARGFTQGLRPFLLKDDE